MKKRPRNNCNNSQTNVRTKQTTPIEEIYMHTRLSA